MPSISVNQFTGLRPAIAETLLANGAAQIAIDCDLSGGSLRPYADNSLVAQPATSNEVKTIYRYTDKNGVQSWIHFESLAHVQRAQISNDTTSRIYYTGDGQPKATDTDRLAVTPGYYLLGVPLPASAPSASVSVVGSNPLSRSYVVTYVTAWGEESAPSPASTDVSVGAGGTVDLTFPNSPNNTDHNPVTKVYIYRTVSGSENTAYQFVAEVAHGVTAYSDSTNDADLPDELLKSKTWIEPPIDLQGLTAMDNGCMAGFREYEVCLSEPYQPHAWPTGYRYASKDKIVAIAVFGNRVVVLTDNKPFILYGTDPAAMSPQNINEVIPCVSAAGVAARTDGVVFPGPDGLWIVGLGGVRNITTEMYTPDDWQALNPSEFKAAIWDEKYVAFTSTQGYLFDLISPDRHIHINEAATAVHIDSGNKNLYINVYRDSANRVYQFNGSSINRVFQWKSKEFFHTDAIAFSAGRVYAKYFGLTQAEVDQLQANYDAAAAANALIFAQGNTNQGVNQGYINEFSINGSDFTDLPAQPPSSVIHIKFWADKALVYEQDVLDRQVFRMPIGYRANVFEFELSSPMEVSLAQFATSARELIAA